MSQKIRDIFLLTKFKIALANALTALAGFSLAQNINEKIFLVFFGTFFMAGGASAVNQILEKSKDILIPRTKIRPLPSERMTEKEAWIIASVYLITGSIMLALSSLISFILGLSAFVIYSFVYTLLKKITPLSLFVGAIVGAIPPLIGYFSASQKISNEAFLLTIFMYAYQIPHTLALFYIYNEEFINSDFKTFAYLGREKIRKIIIITLLITLVIGLAFINAIGKILVAPFLIIAIIGFIRTIQNTKKIFSDLNIFVLLVVLSTVLVKIAQSM